MEHDEQFLAAKSNECIDLSSPVVTSFDVAEVARQYLQQMMRFRPAHEYHEDIGPVLWHRLPVSEAPHVGSTVDEGWFDEPVHILSRGETNAEFYTHFQLIHIPEH